VTVTGPKLPSEATILGVIDEQARAALDHAKAGVGAVVRSQTPRDSGRTAQALAPRTSRTGTGAALTVAPTRGARHGATTVARVVRWVQRGTGVYGPSGKPIRSKRRGGALSVYGREVEQVQGQKPNPFMGRIQALGTLRVEQAARQGAEQAARAVERTVR
jgi:hypothetical protein